MPRTRRGASAFDPDAHRYRAGFSNSASPVLCVSVEVDSRFHSIIAGGEKKGEEALTAAKELRGWQPRSGKVVTGNKKSGVVSVDSGLVRGLRR